MLTAVPSEAMDDNDRCVVSAAFRDATVVEDVEAAAVLHGGNIDKSRSRTGFGLNIEHLTYISSVTLSFQRSLGAGGTKCSQEALDKRCPVTRGLEL